MRVFAFHLLNDYSGSPKVLRQLVTGWSSKGAEVTIVTCSGRQGFLSDIHGIRYSYYWYRWAANPWIRLVNLVLSQCLLFLKMLFIVQRNDLVYINTVLPFGAAFLGKLKGCRIIYHIHETTMKPPLLKKLLFGVVRWAATDIVYVSDFLSKQEPMEGKRVHVLYNAIEDEFMMRGLSHAADKTVHGKNVLMVCSLKTYKGVNEFVALAMRHETYRFTLVVNASMEEIDDYFEGKALPRNLSIFPTQTNLHTFYGRADVVLNLSNPETWVETFGLTIIEGMAYGLPAIVPPVGGIAELVHEGVNGFKVDCRNSSLLSERLTRLLDNSILYGQMRAQAMTRIRQFNEADFLERSWKMLLK